MPSPSTLNAFAVASILLLLIPGPAVLYVVNRSVSDGHATGFFAVCGLTLGNSVHAVAAAVGLSAVLSLLVEKPGPHPGLDYLWRAVVRRKCD